MPALTKRTEALRIDQALQVWGVLEADPTVTQQEACEKVGISVSAYRRWIAEADPVLDEFRMAILGVRRLELMRVLSARETILARVIKDGLDWTTDPATRLEIYKYLYDHSDHLMEAVHTSDSGKADFLTGPNLVEAESRFASHEIEVNLKIRPKEPDIVDGEFEDT